MLHQAAVLVDDYSLTYRIAFWPNDNNNSGGNRDDKFMPPPTPRTTSGTHHTQLDNGKHNGAKRSHLVIHNHYKRRGHVMVQCWSLQQKQNPDALVHSVQEPLGVSGTILENKPSGTVPDRELSDVRLERKPQEAGPYSIYLPIVSDGLVSLTADIVAVPVKILCDTGATQSLLLQGLLPLAKQSSAGARVLVQGVELDVLKVPLHKVYLRSNLVSGVVIVRVRPTLPIQGIAFVMGNNLAVGNL